MASLKNEEMIQTTLGEVIEYPPKLDGDGLGIQISRLAIHVGIPGYALVSFWARLSSPWLQSTSDVISAEMWTPLLVTINRTGDFTAVRTEDQTNKE